MDYITQYEIPYFHPVVVHFPVAMLVAATLFALLWSVRGHARWFTVYASMHFIGTIGAIAAFLTGETIEEDTEGVPIVEELVHTHELYGKISMILAICVSLVILYILYARSRNRQWVTGRGVRSGVLILAIITAITVGMTAHIGGIMVWGVPV